MAVLRIGTPSISFEGDLVRWGVPTTGTDAPAELWFTVQADFGELLTERADPALVALTMAAMHRGMDIHVTGPVTDELVYSLRDTYQDLVSATSEVPKIAIKAEHLLPPAPRATGVATGFSAGVDSYACLADQLLAPDVPRSLRITHLLMNNVGSHGHGEEGRAIWRRRREALAEGAHAFNVPLVEVDSNVDDFYPQSVSFQESHAPRNAAVAHLLGRGIGRWYYASGYTVWDSRVRVKESMDYSDPFVLPLLSTGSLTLLQHGQTLTRVEKTRRIMNVPAAQQNLDVCVAPYATEKGNCSECQKCLRTEVTLDLLGALSRFDKVFDLRIYRKRRDEYLANVLLNPQTPYTAEIRDLLLETRGASRAHRAGIVARGRAISAARFLKWKLNERMRRA